MIKLPEETILPSSVHQAGGNFGVTDQNQGDRVQGSDNEGFSSSCSMSKEGRGSSQTLNPKP